MYTRVYELAREDNVNSRQSIKRRTRYTLDRIHSRHTLPARIYAYVIRLC